MTTTAWQLKKTNRFPVLVGPLVLVVMDGIGLGRQDEGDAVFQARKPTLDRLMKEYPWCRLRAHGKAVGMASDDDMGNSEVGHNALGAGRIFDQGAKLVSQAIASRALFAGESWKQLTGNCLQHRVPLHLIGLLSDGNVHSHIDHLFALIEEADRLGIAEVNLHLLLDGRDVPETSALLYLDRTEEKLRAINARGQRAYRIASGGGRMNVTMDRYEADWSIVERGWKAHVLGQGRSFASARQAIETFRQEKVGVIDQFLPEFVITEAGKPVATIQDGHSVIFFNFRGDRAIEISRAFEQENFNAFNRQRWPKVLYAGMMRYDGDLLIPKSFLVSPPAIDRTMGEYLARNEITQLAISETQKYGHVTYFWNGNRSGKFNADQETYCEIPSDRVSFEQRPWMKAAEITDRTIAEIKSGRHRFIRLNYANGDMVGHTGHLAATIVAVETVDLALERLLSVVREVHGACLILADHGNADEMLEIDKKTGKFLINPRTGKPAPKTSHTLNPVPCIFYDPERQGTYRIAQNLAQPGLSNIASTVLWLLGYEPPNDYDPPLIEAVTSTL